jgi:hypothetical protein
LVSNVPAFDRLRPGLQRRVGGKRWSETVGELRRELGRLGHRIACDQLQLVPVLARLAHD